MELEPLDPGRCRALRRRNEIVTNMIHVDARHGARHLAGRQIGQCRSGHHIDPFPSEFRRPLSPGVAELNADLGVSKTIDQIDNTAPLRLPGVVPQSPRPQPNVS
jgi:hypothetical protein